MSPVVSYLTRRVATSRLVVRHGIVPLTEHKRIFERCRGIFYRCSSGAEARRFNRLRIDAGLIKRL